jgi:hypothetical protein
MRAHPTPHRGWRDRDLRDGWVAGDGVHVDGLNFTPPRLISSLVRRAADVALLIHAGEIAMRASRRGAVRLASELRT